MHKEAVSADDNLYSSDFVVIKDWDLTWGQIVPR